MGYVKVYGGYLSRLRPATSTLDMAVEIGVPSGSGLERTFSATIERGTGPYSYLWDFGDGNTSAEASPTHTYLAADTYLVTLTVTDSLSEQASDSISEEVTAPAELAITRLELWIGETDHTDSNNKIKDLELVDNIDLDTNPAVNVIAIVNDPLGEFSRVEFLVNSVVERVEAGAPLCLAGDRAGNILNTWNVTEGQYTVQAIPYRADDSQGTAITVTLDVTQNAAPVADDVSAQTGNGQAIFIDLTNLVSDADSLIDWSSLSIPVSPASGTAAVNGQGIDYTPATTDDLITFTYQVDDTEGKSSNQGLIEVEIGSYNPPPLLANGSATTEVDQPVNIDIAALATDNNGIDGTSIVVESQPSLGIVTVNSDGTVTYTPPGGVQGFTTFQVSIADLGSPAQRSNTATISVNVGSALQTYYDNYEPRISGVYRFEIVRPAYRQDMTALVDQHTEGTVVNITPSMTPAQIISAVQSAPNGARVVWQSGNYSITSPLNFTRGNIRFESTGQVNLNCSFGPGFPRNAMYWLGGGLTGSSVNITSGLDNEHSYEFGVASAAGFSVGDWVRLSAFARVTSYGSGNQVNVNGTEYNRLTCVAKIVGISGNTLELDRKPAFLPGWLKEVASSQVQKLNVLENIAINGDFRADYTAQLGIADAGDNNNDLGSWEFGAGVSAYFFRNCVNVGLKGMRSVNGPSGGFWLHTMADVYMKDCGAYGAHNRGSGGHGYGVLPEGMCNVVARNWIDERMRHSWGPSLSSASLCMDIEITSTQSNPEFSHGSYDRLQSIRVQEINPHQEGERYRIFDPRAQQVLKRNVGWVGTFGGLKPFGEYDHTLRTLPGVNATFDLRNTGTEHKPGFRNAPNATYETYVAGPGFYNQYVIGIGHGNRIVINPGTHSFRTNNPRGNAYLVAPTVSGSPTIATIEDFRTAAIYSNRADVIFLPQEGGLNYFADLTIAQDDADTVITLANGSSITLLGITASAITEEHIKILHPDRLQRLHFRLGVQYNFQGNNPYVVQQYAQQPGGVEQVVQVWNRDVSLGSATGRWRLADGTLLQTVTAGDVSISGNVVTYTLPAGAAGNIVKPQIDPGFLVDTQGRLGQGLYDWIEEPAVRDVADFSEVVEFA